MTPLVAPLLFLMASASVAPRLPAADPATRAADSGDFLIYETAAGDTLAGLADAHFRDPADWRRARAANAAVLAGAGPSQPLAAGLRLRLDSAWLRRTPVSAEVVAFRGDVELRSGGRVRPARVGAKLVEGDEIATGAVGFVTLRLPDGSEVSLPTSSAVRFDRLRRYSLHGALDRRIRLLAGGSTSRVVPLPDSTSRYEIATPVGVAAVRGTSFRVRYTPGLARASAGVLEGRVGVSAGGAAERLLPAGTGVHFSAAGPGPVTRLPAPPVALDMPALQAGSMARFAVRPAAGLGYRAVVAADPAMRDPLAELSSADGRFVLDGLPAGRYHLEVTAVTADGLEGLPARFTFDVKGREVAAAGGGPAAPPAAGPGPADPDAAAATGARVSGSLDEGLAELGRPVARVWAETFGAGLLEEGDSSEGVDALPLLAGGDPAPLWSLGPGVWPVSAGTSAGAPAAGAFAAPFVAPAGGGMSRPAAWPHGTTAPFAAAAPLLPPLVPGLPVPAGSPGPAGGAVPGAIPGPAAVSPPVPGAAQPLPEAVPAAALVPEPETWVVLVAGFGLVGAGLRARRARRDPGGGRAGAP